MLALAGLRFDVVRPQVDETPHPGEDPIAHVQRLSITKAAEVAARVAPGTLVIAADTIVVHAGEILGKPATPEEATRTLRRLRGDVHQVHTALAAQRGDWRAAEVVTTGVRMRAYTDAEIAAYVASGDPMDKAGAYAIQNTTFNLVAGLDGCYANVMGFPLCRLERLLEPLGVALPGLPESCRQADGAACGVYQIVLSAG
ncbi:MAG: Maf family nucleotide pyrophosphatase [Anaerolineae bacterium]